MLNVEIHIKTAYGRELIRPINEEAKLLCKFSGQTTFTREQLKILHELGCKIRLSKVEPLDLPDFIDQDTYK